MTKRQQLPPQIKKITVKDRTTGKDVVRYQLTVDAGVDRETGKRKQIRRRFATEKAARDELATVAGGVTAGTYVHHNSITVDTACEEWLASKHSLKASTLAGHRSKLQALRDELGHLELQTLTEGHLDGLIGRLRRGECEGRKCWSPRSCNYLLYLTTAVLEKQRRQRRLVSNVAADIDRVAGDPKGKTTLTIEQMYAVLGRKGRDQHLWAMALYGMRRGEIAGLRWTNVNLTGKTIGDGEEALPPRHIRICENRVAVGKTILKGTPKSKASNRTLPLPPELLTALKAARKRQAAERLAAGPSYCEGGYVACDEFGKPYNPNLLYYRWGRMLRELKIKPVRLHDARHTCGTLMHLRGVPIAVIAAWLGHSSPAFTAAVYLHSQTDALADAAGSLGRVVTTRDTETGSGDQ